MALAAELARLVLAGEREHPGPSRASFLKDDQRTAAIEKKMNFFGQQLRIFDRELAGANCVRTLADQRGISVVMLAAQVQERIDINVVEFEFRDRALRVFSARSIDDRIVKRAPLLRLKIFARRDCVSIEFAGVKVVQNKAQRLQLVAQNVDRFN